MTADAVIKPSPEVKRVKIEDECRLDLSSIPMAPVVGSAAVAFKTEPGCDGIDRKPQSIPSSLPVAGNRSSNVRVHQLPIMSSISILMVQQADFDDLMTGRSDAPVGSRVGKFIIEASSQSIVTMIVCALISTEGR